MLPGLDAFDRRCIIASRIKCVWTCPEMCRSCRSARRRWSRSFRTLSIGPADQSPRSSATKACDTGRTKVEELFSVSEPKYENYFYNSEAGALAWSVVCSRPFLMRSWVGPAHVRNLQEPRMSEIGKVAFSVAGVGCNSTQHRKAHGDR